MLTQELGELPSPDLLMPLLSPQPLGKLLLCSWVSGLGGWIPPSMPTARLQGAPRPRLFLLAMEMGQVGGPIQVERVR